MRVSLVSLSLLPGVTPGFNEHEEPLGLCYVAQAVRRAGYSVSLVQQIGESDEAILRRIIALEPNVLGFTAVTAVGGRAAKMAAEAKERLPGLATIVGGSHACAVPGQCAEHFDYVVVGEGEDTFVRLLATIRAGQLPAYPGLCYMHGGAVVFTGYPKRINELDGLLPTREGLNLRAYDPSGSPPVPDGTTGFAAMITSRGCPHQCEFCSNHSIWRDGPTGKPCVTFRSREDVVREVLELRDTHQVNYIAVEDTDVLLRPRADLLELLHALQRKALGVRWACMTRPDRILPRWPATSADLAAAQVLLQEMHYAGCHLICLGVESGDPSLRQTMGRRFDNEQMRAVFELVFRAHIASTAFLLLGYPGETRSSLARTQRLVRELPATRIRASFFYPFGNTPRAADSRLKWIRPELAEPRYATTEQPTVSCDVSACELIHFKETLLEQFYCSDSYRNRMESMQRWSPFWQRTIRGWGSQLARMCPAYNGAGLAGMACVAAPSEGSRWEEESSRGIHAICD